jgi:DNA-directed RNA polymerase specialized sigma24 family protein
MILLSEHAEARMRGIILARLRSYFSSQEQSEDFEDLFSESKTRLLTYLYELKEGLRTTPCEDFRAYVAAIAHNACHDHFRQMYPARTPAPQEDS